MEGFIGWFAETPQDSCTSPLPLQDLAEMYARVC